MRRSREVDKDTIRLSKMKKSINAGVAQLVEQRIRNAQVAGSSPATSSKVKQTPSRCLFCFQYDFGIEPAISFGVPIKPLALWGEEKHMKCSFAKAAAFCAEHGICLDEVRPPAPKIPKQNFCLGIFNIMRLG